MKNLIAAVIAIFFIGSAQGQMTASEMKEHRSAHKTYLLDTNSHWLNKEEVENFQGLDYFDFDSTYQINVVFTKDKGKKFEMPTSTARLPVYRRYGYIDFMIDSAACRLTVYQNVAASKKKENKKYLFIPFKDKTTRESTYGGGRFLDFEIPENENIVLDFNLSYNPYCAYTTNSSCPIPPDENILKIEINAGEKTPLGH
ncbi:MAG: DUF1684 domain-containing protein [Crocinitomicaceae bacterium]|nr:DUF1684 domain-containing protein [Crocinitomicaceae bacterium]